jgi:hypothetical protein
MIFRLSQNLSVKIKSGPLTIVAMDENPYADWSARLFHADRCQYVLVSNTRSLYSIVMFGRGITNGGSFADRTLEHIREFMKDDGLEFIYRQFIEPASYSVKFGKALDRTVTGSQNELVSFAKEYLISGELSPGQVAIKLNAIPMSAAALGKSRTYGIPREAFKRLG